LNAGCHAYSNITKSREKREIWKIFELGGEAYIGFTKIIPTTKRLDTLRAVAISKCMVVMHRELVSGMDPLVPDKPLNLLASEQGGRFIGVPAVPKYKKAPDCSGAFFGCCADRRFRPSGKD
jgi:hypothetical protein